MADRFAIQVVPLRCPCCSDTFQAGEQDVIFFCRQCGTAWEVAGITLLERKIIHMPGEETPHFPFWIFPFAVTTQAGRAATLQEYLSLTGNIAQLTPKRAAKPPAVFVPAFSNGTPQQLLRSGRLLTLRAPEITVSREHPHHILPVTFREADARAMTETVVLSTLTEERKTNLQLLQGFSLEVGNAFLLTIPFINRGGRLFQQGMNLEI